MGQTASADTAAGSAGAVNGSGLGRSSSSQLPTSTDAAPVEASAFPGSLLSHRVSRIEEEEEELLEAEGASSISSVFTLCNSAIGAGVLSLPFAFRCAGAAGTLLLCLVLASFEGLTLYVLSKFAERYDAKTYSILVRKALGRKLSAALSATLVIYQMGSCAAYLIIIGDTVGPLMANGLGADHWYCSRHVIISFFALVIILPLCYPRNLSSLHYVSTAGVVGFMYTAVAIMIEGSKIFHAKEDPWGEVKWFIIDFQALFAIPIIVFGFNCHANVVTVFNELGEKPDVLVPNLPTDPEAYRDENSMSYAPKPRTLKLIGMISVILAAVGVIMFGYLAVGFAGYLAYPTTVDSNVLKSFPAHPLLLKIARGAIAGVVTGHYPLNNNAARVGLEHLEAYYLGWKNLPLWVSRGQTTLFVLVTLAIGLTVTDLGQVLHMIGGTAAAFIIFFLPGLLLVNAAIVKVDMPAGPTPSTDLDEIDTPLIADENEIGIKRTGLIYSPRRSWWAGMLLITLAVFIFVITIATAFLAPSE